MRHAVLDGLRDNGCSGDGRSRERRAWRGRIRRTSEHQRRASIERRHRLGHARRARRRRLFGCDPSPVRVDGWNPERLGCRTATPSANGWFTEWDSRTVANGTYSLESIATSSGGKTSTSPGISITVNNSSPGPIKTACPDISKRRVVALAGQRHRIRHDGPDAPLTHWARITLHDEYDSRALTALSSGVGSSNVHNDVALGFGDRQRSARRSATLRVDPSDVTCQIRRPRYGD